MLVPLLELVVGDAAHRHVMEPQLGRLMSPMLPRGQDSLPMVVPDPAQSCLPVHWLDHQLDNPLVYICNTST